MALFAPRFILNSECQRREPDCSYSALSIGMAWPLTRRAWPSSRAAASDQNGSVAGSPSGRNAAEQRYRLPVEM